MQSSRETRRRPSFHRSLRLPLCMSKVLSLSVCQKFSLSLSIYIILPLFQHFGTAWAGLVGALLAAIFARRKPLFQPRLS